MSTPALTKSTTTPDSDTAGSSPPRAATPAVVRPAARSRRWRFHRSLSAKAVLLAVIFLAVPLIVYDQFRAPDDATAPPILPQDGHTRPGVGPAVPPRPRAPSPPP